MNQVLEKNRTASGEAVLGLVHALTYLENLKDEMARCCRNQPPRHSDDMVAIKLGRAVSHLRDAVGDLPDELLVQTFEKRISDSGEARHLAAAQVFERLTSMAVTHEVR